MATEFSPPTLREKTDYELWKLETQAWTVVTDIRVEKQAVAVALNIPGDDKRKLKEKVFGELGLSALNSENGMKNLFRFLDRYLLEDEVMSSWRRFEDFEKFERKHGQNIRDYVDNFDFKSSIVEKLHVKLPSEILALKLLSKANLTERERMIVLTGVNFNDKENMYRNAKNSLIKFMGDRSEEQDRIGLDVKLQPAWRSANTIRKSAHVQHNSKRLMKKNMNPSGTDGKILLCHSCGSYRHFVAECPHSWENMVKNKSSMTDGKIGDQNEDRKLKDKENGNIQPVKPEDIGSVQVASNQLVIDVPRLTAEIKNLEADIKEIKAVLDNTLRRQIEESGVLSDMEKISNMNKERKQEKSGTFLHEIRQFKKLQGDYSSRLFEEMKKKQSSNNSFSENNQYDRVILESGIGIYRAFEKCEERNKHSGKQGTLDGKKETYIKLIQEVYEKHNSNNGIKQRLLRKAKNANKRFDSFKVIVLEN